MIDRDSHNIVKLLKKKTRASAAEVGTDAATMKLLEVAGVVKADGTIKGAGRGRPPVAWKLNPKADLDNLPIIDEPVRRNAEDGISQAQIDKIINEVNAGAFGHLCRCDLKPGMSLADIRALNIGCTENWTCNALTAVRRRLGV